MFNYFSDNYMWSSTVMMGLMAGGQLGEMHRWLEPLRHVEPDMQAWDKAWSGMAAQQEDLASANLKNGYQLSAGARYARAAAYRLLGERQMPLGADKFERYQAALVTFDAAARYAPFPIERVEIASPDGPLPGYLIPAGTQEPAPVVIFYSGLDASKELLYLFIREEFVRRDISVLAMDTPGVGAPLRLRGVPSRPDYEAPTAAIIDYLERRTDIDPNRIGILGISLGGYYAPRAAAFEPRIKACAAWGGVLGLWRAVETTLGNPDQEHFSRVLPIAVDHGHRDHGGSAQAGPAIQIGRRDAAPHSAVARAPRRPRPGHPG